jgi:acyl dehydratase
VYIHSPGRTVSEVDNILFSTLTMNTQPLHLDAEWSRGTEFGERLINSMFILSALRVV